MGGARFPGLRSGEQPLGPRYSPACAGEIADVEGAKGPGANAVGQ